MSETVEISPEAFAVSFRHGWDAAIDEAILIAETAEFKDESMAELVAALKEFREANR